MARLLFKNVIRWGREGGFFERGPSICYFDREGKRLDDKSVY